MIPRNCISTEPQMSRLLIHGVLTGVPPLAGPRREDRLGRGDELRMKLLERGRAGIWGPHLLPHVILPTAARWLRQSARSWQCSRNSVAAPSAELSPHAGRCSPLPSPALVLAQCRPSPGPWCLCSAAAGCRWCWAPRLSRAGSGSNCHVPAQSFATKTASPHHPPRRAWREEWAPKTVAQRPRLRAPPRRLVEINTVNQTKGSARGHCQAALPVGSSHAAVVPGAPVGQREAWPVGTQEPRSVPQALALLRARTSSCSVDEPTGGGPALPALVPAQVASSYLIRSSGHREQPLDCVSQWLREDELQLLPYPFPGSVYVQSVHKAVPGNVTGTQHEVI